MEGWGRFEGREVENRGRMEGWGRFEGREVENRGKGWKGGVGLKAGK